MPTEPSPVRHLWFRALIVGGVTLALTMLVQTAIGYRYVTRGLVLQEARRGGEQIVRHIEEQIRMGGADNKEAVAAVVDDVWRGLRGQAAWIVVTNGQGEVLAARGRDHLSLDRAVIDKALEARQPAMAFGDQDGRSVAVGAFFCRCSVATADAQGARLTNASLVTTPTGTNGQSAGVTRPQPPVVEIGLYQSALSAPFARVRRNAAINAGTALALLVALGGLAVRFRSHLRGRQAEAQLVAARQVQRDLMPVADVRTPGVEVAAASLPASHVSGDLVDVLTLPGGRVGFLLADVSGKGAPAALLTGLVQGAMHASAPDLAGQEPETVAARVNELLLQKSNPGRFASMFWCAFDPASSAIRFVNAGHPPAFLVRTDGQVERLTTGGPVLGVIGGAAYESAAVKVNVGDLLVMYSDGLLEATNASDDEFGIDRVAAAVVANATSSARGICDALGAAVEGFAAPDSPRDDRTALVVRFTSRFAAVSDTRQAA